MRFNRIWWRVNNQIDNFLKYLIVQVLLSSLFILSKWFSLSQKSNPVYNMIIIKHKQLLSITSVFRFGLQTRTFDLHGIWPFIVNRMVPCSRSSWDRTKRADFLMEIQTVSWVRIWPDFVVRRGLGRTFDRNSWSNWPDQEFQVNPVCTCVLFVDRLSTSDDFDVWTIFFWPQTSSASGYNWKRDISIFNSHVQLVHHSK